MFGIKSWKTTLFGILATLPNILHLIGIVLPDPVTAALTGICGLIAWLFAKDSNVTGGTVKQ
jgi:uncharacterized membrane protein